MRIRPPDRRRRGHDLRRDPPAALLPRRKPVDGHLVETGHRSERPGDEVQLVLDDQAGRRDNALALLVQPEEVPGLGTPGHHGELVDGPDHDRGTHFIDVFID